MPEYQNIDFNFSAKPTIANPIPTFLEEVRAIRKEDKEYTDFLLRWIRDTIIDDLIDKFYSWLHDLFYVNYLYLVKKCGDFFRLVLSIFKQWLIHWLEGICLD